MQTEGSFQKGSASDHLANERTYLAWIRTAIAVMAFGFVVAKFSLFVRQLQKTAGEIVRKGSPMEDADFIGIALVMFGALLILFAFMRYKHVERQLKSNAFAYSPTLMTVISIVMFLGSLFLIFYLLRYG